MTLHKANPSRATREADSFKLNNTPPVEYIRRVNNLAMTNARSIVQEIVAGGRFQGSEYVCRNPRRNDQTLGSFKFNVVTGAWSDFATGDKDGDFVSWFAYVRGIQNQFDAARELAQTIGYSADTIVENQVSAVAKRQEKDDEYRQLEVVPAELLNALPPRATQADAMYQYKRANGDVAFVACRFDANVFRKDKEFRQLSAWLNLRNNEAVWRWKNKIVHRPLYNLHKLPSFPADGVIVICEGEKACEAAQALFGIGGYLCMSWSQGTQSIDKTDFLPLSGRRVYLWPDNDEPGREAMRKLAQKLRAIGVSELAVIRNEAFLDVPGSGKLQQLDQGFDAADAVTAGWHSGLLTELYTRDWITDISIVGDDKSTTTTGSGSNVIEHSAAPGAQRTKWRSYTVDELGVWFNPPPDQEGKERTWICTPLKVTAFARDEQGQNWGRLLEFRDHEGRHHKWCMPMELLRGSGEDYRGILLSMGLEIAPGTKARDHLTTYIQTSRPDMFARCVSTPGWSLLEAD